MGVPAFFRWLCKKYPSIVTQCVEEKGKVNPLTEEKIPVDTSQPNPNGIEFDNLYLDMNGIIHPCTHPEDRPAPKNEDEMMILIFEFIDKIFAIVRPRKVLYMAIDGVAPRAKMNQQRSRRFRAAKEGFEKTSEIKRLRETIISNGGQVPPEVPHSEKFDSNCITPGTPFMFKLADCLRYYVHSRLNSDPGWKNIIVFLSDANVPGEGEHKIMDYIRRQRANPAHDPNTHHVLCGADADLIMLGLATHEPYFTIIREEFRPNQPRPCEVCSQFGHETKECQGIARVKSGKHDEMANSFTPSEGHHIFLRISILREYLNKELYLPNLPFKFDIERAIDDWVFMCFFVGNDFLPHLPSLEIREGAIDRLVNLYKNMISQSDGYLTNSGDVDLDRVQIIMSGIGEVEDDIFKKRQRNELEFRRRQKDKNRNNQRNRMGNDFPSQMPSWMKSGAFAPQPLGRNFKPASNANAANPVQTTNKFDIFSLQSKEETQTSGNGEDKRGIKRKHPKEESSIIVLDDSTAEAKEPDEEPMSQQKTEATTDKPEATDKEEVEEDEDASDPIRLWEDGWKHRYYKVKFDIDQDDLAFRQKIARHYTLGLQWVLKYYYQGVPSWDWYFPYHYAPFASDFIGINETQNNFHEITEPFRPFEQLMAVFPAASRSHVPEPWQKLMTNKESVIIDFYPEDFQIDLNGKKQAWQGVALLPFVDEKRLKKTLAAVYEQLTLHEKKRNTRGNDRFFVGQCHALYNFFKREVYDKENTVNCFEQSIDINTDESSGISGKIWTDDIGCKENQTFKSPIVYCCPDIENNKVISVKYHDPIYENEFVFKTVILQGAKIPEPVLRPEDFEQNQRGYGNGNGNYRPHNGGFNRNQRPNNDPSVANRMLQNSLGGGGGSSGNDNQEMVGSSAYGGQSSVYGSYKTSNNNNNNNNNNVNPNYRQNNNYNYNNNYNNNGNNNNGNRNSGYNSNGNNNYNNNNRGNYNNNGNNGGGYNNNYNNNNQRGNFNQGNNFNNNRNNMNNNFRQNGSGNYQQQQQQQQQGGANNNNNNNRQQQQYNQ
jgi:5'-3' exoribonuclease 2